MCVQHLAELLIYKSKEEATGNARVRVVMRYAMEHTYTGSRAH
jgi:hypothetical protein